MKNLLIVCLVFGLFSGISALERAWYADEFLKTDFGARTAAMGGTYGAVENELASLYYNPAGLSSITGKQTMFMHAEVFNGIILTDLFSFGTNLNPDLGAGIAYFRSAVPNIKIISEDVEPQPYNAELKTAVDHVLFVGVGKRLWKKLSVGGTMKIFYRSLVTGSGYGAAGDLAFQYDFIRAFSAGLTLQNITSAYTTWETGHNEMAYPSACLQFTYLKDIPYFYGSISLHYALGSFLPYDNVATISPKTQTSAAFYDDPLAWIKTSQGGIEYNFKDLFFLRGGLHPLYKFTAGAGMGLQKENVRKPGLQNLMNKAKISSFRIDYAFKSHTELNEGHLLSLSLGF